MEDNKGQVILEVLDMVDTEGLIEEEIDENPATVEEEIDTAAIVNGNVKPKDR